MPVHIRIGLPTERDRKRHTPRHDDDIRPGWTRHRDEPEIEPPAKSLSLANGQWLARATANSGPRIAPGCGTRKSS